MLVVAKFWLCYIICIEHHFIFWSLSTRWTNTLLVVFQSLYTKIVEDMSFISVTIVLRMYCFILTNILHICMDVHFFMKLDSCVNTHVFQSIFAFLFVDKILSFHILTCVVLHVFLCIPFNVMGRNRCCLIYKLIHEFYLLNKRFFS